MAQTQKGEDWGAESVVDGMERQVAVRFQRALNARMGSYDYLLGNETPPNV